MFQKKSFLLVKIKILLKFICKFQQKIQKIIYFISREIIIRDRSNKAEE